MAQNSVFERLAQIADISALTKEERNKYDESIKQYRDALSVYEGARMDGREEGRAEGETRGRMLTAQNLKAMGMSIDVIMQATGLTADEVEAHYGV